MKRFLVTIVLCALFSALMSAQKNFVYLKFNPADGNSEKVVSQLNRIWNIGNSVLFMSYGEKPIMADNDDDFRDIKLKLVSMQSEMSFSAQSELEFFDSCLVSIFNESVTSDLLITGTCDHGSQCVFIVSERMFNDMESSEFLKELIAVNNLDERMNVSIYTYNDETVTERNGFLNNGKIKYNKK